MKLKQSEPKKWRKISDTFSFAGQAFLDKKLLDDGSISALFEKINSIQEFNNLLNKLNGSFAIVGETQSGIRFGAVDISASIPLFINLKSQQFTFAISPNSVEFHSNDIDQKQAELLQNLAFVPQHKTLLKNFLKLQAGQLVWINECVEVQYYYQHFSEKVEASYSDYKKELSQVLENLAYRFCHLLKGKTAWIPLSGGYDSRLVLALLLKGGHADIQTFTYGKADQVEALKAKEIANILNVDWHFIPYTESIFTNYFGDDWKNYMEYAANFSSLPQEQEFFAVQYLRDHDLLKEENVFCPGYCGDVPAGSYVPDAVFKYLWKLNPTPISALKYISNLFQVSPDLLWTSSIKKKSHSYTEFISEVEEFVTREKLSKYIVNGVRCYEFFDADWNLTLWDKEFIDFWLKVPLKFRENKKLYIEVITENYFEPLKINLEKKERKSSLLVNIFRIILKQLIPKPVKTKLKNKMYSTQEEVNNLDLLSKMIAEKLQIPYKNQSINEMNALWYLSHIQKINGKGSKTSTEETL